MNRRSMFKGLAAAIAGGRQAVDAVAKEAVSLGMSQAGAVAGPAMSFGKYNTVNPEPDYKLNAVNTLRQSLSKWTEPSYDEFRKELLSDQSYDVGAGYTECPFRSANGYVKRQWQKERSLHEAIMSHIRHRYGVKKHWTQQLNEFLTGTTGESSD